MLSQYSIHVQPGFSPENFLHLVQIEQMSVGLKITHGADKFTLGACHLVWIAVCTKSLNLHLVVWQWYKFTPGGSSLYQRYTWCSHQVCYTLARTLRTTSNLQRALNEKS